LLSVATILNLTSYTQKIPQTHWRQSFLLLFSVCELMPQIPCLLPTLDSDEHSPRKRTSPMRAQIHRSLLPPPQPNPTRKSKTDDVILYTVSDWLLSGKSVSPRYDQRLIKRNESDEKTKKLSIWSYTEDLRLHLMRLLASYL